MRRPSDEMILARIIAGARASGRMVDRGAWGGEYVSDGQCCAIGAGCLYAGVLPTADEVEQDEAGDGESYGFTLVPGRFANAHRVTIIYALGVSDGFEAHEKAASIHRLTKRERSSREYRRGLAVGEAAYAALVGYAP